MAENLQTTPFTILVDDREKGGTNMQHDRMFDFRIYSVPVRRAHLAQGDYSLLGYDGRFAIERKSPSDLVSTLFGFHRAGGRKVSNCERFALELQRLADYEHVYVSVTGSERDVAEAARKHALEVYTRTGGRYKYPPNPDAVFNLMAALSAEFAIPFVLFPDVATAERQALRDFRAWHRKALGLSHVGSMRSKSGICRVGNG